MLANSLKLLPPRNSAPSVHALVLDRGVSRQMYASSCGNGFLDLLLGQDRPALETLLRSADLVEAEAGTLLQHAAEPIEFVFFPTSGILTFNWPTADGYSVSTLGIGRDGAVHACAGIDLASATYNVKVQLSGSVLRLPARPWHDLLDNDEDLRRVLARYAEFLLACSQQNLTCLMRHDVESRLCHWLLQMDDWQAGRPLAITHHGTAELLGVRRTTISLLARVLQDAGIISYRRGQIEVTDYYALQQASCECYEQRQMLRARFSVHQFARMACLAADIEPSRRADSDWAPGNTRSSGANTFRQK